MWNHRTRVWTDSTKDMYTKRFEFRAGSPTRHEDLTLVHPGPGWDNKLKEHTSPFSRPREA